ncbi:DUF3016 domain-containing protein [Lysobacter arenosi]|uniref:DUF3016 domain-containing protein n=1 Tax=Lysobacter arenosi TaxID=2795387 RepID=A0ABX7RA80_9GAMM|nr:DUF3016 domain-containing protein [Lysobacter arenosi]QSX74635.1 DUF3016 domain-containing protein [Lysobacter arenosi]
MNLRPALIAIALAIVSAGVPADARTRNVTDPDAPRALPEQGPVSVRWEDPSTFSDLRHSGNRYEARRGNWVEELAEHMRKSGEKRLAPGQRLDIDILDIRRAGMYEPWHGPDLDDTRIIRDIYPPRMTVSFRYTDADGRVLSQGERKLSDNGFMVGASPVNNNDILRYEKSMIDSWLTREIGAPQT